MVFSLNSFSVFVRQIQCYEATFVIFTVELLFFLSAAVSFHVEHMDNMNMELPHHGTSTNINFREIGESKGNRMSALLT